MKGIYLLLLALALNVQAQSLWLTSYPPIGISPKWDHRLPGDLSSVPWLKLRIEESPGKANAVVIISAKEPRVTQIDGEWKITFITP